MPENKSILEPHGPGKAFYNRLAINGTLAGSPTLSCVCGAIPAAIFETWEQAGKWLDGHIASELQKQADAYREHLNEQKETRGEMLRKVAARR